MKFTNILLTLVVVAVVVLMVKPSFFYRVMDRISGMFVSEVRSVSKTVVKGKKEKNEQLQGLDKP